MYKKILTYTIPLIVGFFSVFSDSFAVTYNSSPVFNLPYVNTTTGATIYYNSVNTFYWSYFQRSGTNTWFSVTDAIRVGSGFTHSGGLYTYAWCNSLCGNGGPYTIVRVLYSPAINNGTITLKFYDEDFNSGFSPANIDESNLSYSLTIEDVNLGRTCPGGTGDCIMALKMDFSQDDFTGLYFDGLQYYFYNNASGSYERLHYRPSGGSRIIDPSQLSFSVNSYGGVENGYNHTNYWRQIANTSGLLDEFTLSGYLNSYTPPGSLQYTLPIWLSSSGSVSYSVGGTGSTNTGTTGSGVTDGWYDNCTSFIDVGCYIVETFNGIFSFSQPIVDFVSNLGTLFLDLLDAILNTSWDAVQMDTVTGTGNCTPQLFSVLSTNNTGGLFDKISSSIIGGVSQIMSVWNAPEDEQYYCLFGEGTYIDYGRFRGSQGLFWLDYLILLASIVAISVAMSKLIIRNEQ